MTITFEKDQDVLVYPLEKVISYAERTRQIFVAQCVWWLASIWPLEDGWVICIDDHRQWASIEHSVKVVALQNTRWISATPRDILEKSRSDIKSQHIHPDRMFQVRNTISDVSVCDLGCTRSCHQAKPFRDSERLQRVIQEGSKFNHYSRKERQAFDKQKGSLSRTRSGKIPMKPFKKKQMNQLQAIPKDTIADHLSARK